MLLAQLVLIVTSLTALADSEIGQCKKARSRFFPHASNVTVECTDAHLHFRPATPGAAGSSAQLRVGSFNVFHLGDNMSFFKDYALVAQLFDRWDVVGALELSPLPNRDEDHNRGLDRMIQHLGPDGSAQSPQGATFSSLELRKQYEPPGYIRLWLELRKRDPNWALLVSSESSGESSHQELAGIFYRADRLKPVGSEACDGDIACSMRILPPLQRFVSRTPFLAAFRAGSFDFWLAAMHSRFRPSPVAGSLDNALEYFPANEWGFAQPSSNANGWTKGDEVARFAELKAVVESLDDARSGSDERDIILAGDFNLEREAGQSQAWQRSWLEALKPMTGAKAFVMSPTTVSDNDLVSSYDHFILNPVVVTECQAAQAKAVDFTSLLSGEIDSFLAQGSANSQRLKQRLSSAVSVSDTTTPHLIRRYTGQETTSWVSKLASRVLDAGLSKPLAPGMELVSDHIPIEMTCKTSESDDD